MTEKTTPRHAYRRGTLRRLVLHGGVAVATALAAVTTAGTATAAARLDVTVAATFDAGPQTRVVAAAVSPADPGSHEWITPNRKPITLTVACADAAPCAAEDGAAVSWSFGDGDTVDQSYTINGGGLQVTSTRRTAAGVGTTETAAVGVDRVIQVDHYYLAPGDFTAQVKVTTAVGIGTGTIRALVSQRYADADVDASAKPGRPDRTALWTASALGWLTSCRTAIDQADGVEPGSTDDRRALLCPAPTSTWTQWTGSTPTPLPMPAGATANGLTGDNCLSSAAACGLPANVFARYAGGDPTKPCNTNCRTALANAGTTDDVGAVTHDPLNCADGWTAARSNGTWSIVAGVEPGCVTRGTLFTAIVAAVDGPNPQHRRLAAASVCPDGLPAGGVADAVLRAAALGIPVTHTRGGSAKCDVNLPATKADVYTTVGKAVGATSATATTLRDLANVTLGHGSAAAYPGSGQIGALLATGSPVVGSTACADGGSGTCFNPNDPVTRGQLATLIAGQLVGLPTLSSGLQATLTTSANPVKVGQQVTLRARIQAPAQTSASATVTVTWPAPVDGVSSRSCAATSTATFGSSRFVTLTCGWTRSTAGTTALTIGVKTSDGLSTSATVPLTASNTAPVVDGSDMPTATEDVDGTTLNLTATDKDGGAGGLAYKVRSFGPSEPDPGIYPQTGKRATTAWSDTAEVAVGKITATAGAGQVTLRLDRTTDAQGATVANAYGPYSFALQVCDSAGACTVRTVDGDVTAVNNAPTTPSLTTVSGPASQTWDITLSGDDSADANRPGYPDGPSIVSYRIDAVPVGGTVRYDADPGPGTNWLVATAGATTNNPTVQFTAPAGTGGDSFTYSAQDAGYPGTMWSVSPTSVMLDWS